MTSEFDMNVCVSVALKAAASMTSKIRGKQNEKKRNLQIFAKSKWNFILIGTLISGAIFNAPRSEYQCLNCFAHRHVN